MKYLFICMIIFPLLCSAQQRSILGIEIAKKELKQALLDRTNKTTSIKNVISDKQTAIAMAELILFKIYGQKQIISERPYEVYLINGYWVLNGTLPKGSDGVGFLIILNSNNGQVIKLIHYK